jgi:hypothetical protein
MQHATKMVMVPQDTYSSLMSQQKQLYSPVVQQMSNLDQELQAILSNPNLPTDLKYNQYKNVFNRYQQLRQQQFQPTTKVVASTDIQTGEDLPTYVLPLEERQLIDSLPKTVRRKGKILLDHLKERKNNFSWLSSGELVVDGQPIEGSNITDLVHHVTRRRPTVKPPIGADAFADLLNRTNVPKEALSESNIFATPVGLGTSFSPASTSTPSKLKKAPKAKASSVRPVRIRKPVNRWQAY